MPETVDAKKLSAANPICTCKYLFLFRITTYMHIPTENRLNHADRRERAAGRPLLGHGIPDALVFGDIFLTSSWVRRGVFRHSRSPVIYGDESQ